MSTAQAEKDFVAHFAEQTRTLAPEEIAKDPRNKELGHSSRCLSVKDFELIRTLGTGVYITCPFRCSGTYVV
jgi:protein kinase A